MLAATEMFSNCILPVPPTEISASDVVLCVCVCVREGEGEEREREKEVKPHTVKLQFHFEHSMDRPNIQCFRLASLCAY